MSQKLRQLKVLLKKDLYVFAQRPQYRLYVVLMAVLVTYSVISGIQRYRISIESHQHWRELQQQAISQLVYAPSLKGPGYTERFPPAMMSVFAQGADELITVPFVTRSWTKQQIGYFTPDGSITRLIPSLDFLVLVLLLGGLFTVWLCHDFALQEIANRTIITNVLFQVSERMFVLSKVLAMIVAAALPTLILFFVGACAVPLFAGKPTDAYVVRCASFIGVLLLYQAFWVGVALLVQSLAPGQRTSLIYGIAAWILISFVFPNLSMISSSEQRFAAVKHYFDRKTATAAATLKTYRAWRKEDSPPSLGMFELFEYQAQVEKKLLAEGEYDRLLEATSADTRQRLTSFTSAAVSPYTATAVAATEVANTGLGTYVATRGEMRKYHRLYVEVENSAPVRTWAEKFRPPPPADELKRLDVDLQRPDFGRNAHDARVPVLGLLVDILLIVPLGMMLMERRLGARRPRKRVAA